MENDIQSSNFNVKHVDEWIKHWSEGYRLDYKEQFYPLDDEKERLTFINHVIALANIARRTGLPCYMIFGVTDNGNKVVGIENQFPAHQPPAPWFDPDIAMKKKQTDFVGEEFRETIEKYISPSPEVMYEFGVYKSWFLSYLIINPCTCNQCFSLKRNLFHKGKGTVYIRSGPNSIEVDRTEASHLLSKAQAAYLKPRYWLSLIQSHLTNDFQKNHDLSPFFKAKIASSIEFAEDHIFNLLTKAVNKTIRIVSAPAGDGKTVLLHRSAYAIANLHNLERVTNNGYLHSNGKTELEIIYDVGVELEVVPLHPVPVFFPLRTNFDSVAELEKQIVGKIIEYMKVSETDNVSPANLSLNSLFQIPNSRWAIFLDGIDEIQNRKQAGKILGKWLRTLPNNVSAIISSRPYAVENITDFEKINLAQLDNAEILYLIEAKIRNKNPDSTITQIFFVAKAKEILANHPEFSELLYRQRAIDGFVNYFSKYSAEPTSEIDHRNFELAPKFNPNNVTDNPSAISGLTDLPIFNQDELLGDDSQLPGNPDEDSQGTSDNDTFDLQDINFVKFEAVQNIIDHIRREEIIRHAELGIDEREIAEIATHQLQIISWKIGWDQLPINISKFSRDAPKKSIDWNVYIGHLQRDEYPFYHFSNFLIRAFFAATYAYRIINDDNQVTSHFHSLENELSCLSKSLYMEACKTNGKFTSLQLQGG